MTDEELDAMGDHIAECDCGCCVNVAWQLLNEVFRLRGLVPAPWRPRVGKQRVHLTDEQVAEMRRRYAQGEGPSTLARAFNVSPSWAGMIVHRLAR